MRPAITAERPRRCQAVRSRGGHSRQRPGHGRVAGIAWPSLPSEYPAVVIRRMFSGLAGIVEGPPAIPARFPELRRMLGFAHVPAARTPDRGAGFSGNSRRMLRRSTSAAPAAPPGSSGCRSTRAPAPRTPRGTTAPRSVPASRSAVVPTAARRRSPRRRTTAPSCGRGAGRCWANTSRRNMKPLTRLRLSRKNPIPTRPEQPALLGFERSQGA